MALKKPVQFCMLSNVHCCVVFVLGVTTLFFPLSGACFCSEGDVIDNKDTLTNVTFLF